MFPRTHPLLKSWPPKLSPFSWLNQPSRPDPLVNTPRLHSDPSHISNNLLDQHRLSRADAKYPWLTLGLLTHLKPLHYLSLKIPTSFASLIPPPSHLISASKQFRHDRILVSRPHHKLAPVLATSYLPPCSHHDSNPSSHVLSPGCALLQCFCLLIPSTIYLSYCLSTPQLISNSHFIVNHSNFSRLSRNSFYFFVFI